MKIIVIGAKPVSLIKFRGEMLRCMLAAGHEVIAMADDSDPAAAAQVEALGATFVPYHVHRAGLNPLSDLRTLRELIAVIRTRQPDLVMAYTIKPVLWGGLAVRMAGHARFFPLITGLGFAFSRGGVRKAVLRAIVVRLYKLALGGAQTVIFQNQDNLMLFVELGIVPAKRCRRVAGSGVDLAMYAQTPLPDVPPVTFLCIARLLADKGIREYAEAARQVRRRRRDVRFLLVGEADPSPNRIELVEVKRWHDAGDIEYLGAKADVRPSLDACHVYVLPSYHEGLPRTVLEAMARGRPIITTDTVGCRDTVVPGVNGVLIEPGSADRLREAMEWFIDNPASWQQFGQASRALAEQTFDVRKVNAELMSIMEL